MRDRLFANFRIFEPSAPPKRGRRPFYHGLWADKKNLLYQKIVSIFLIGKKDRRRAAALGVWGESTEKNTLYVNRSMRSEDELKKVLCLSERRLESQENDLCRSLKHALYIQIGKKSPPFSASDAANEPLLLFYAKA